MSKENLLMSTREYIRLLRRAVRTLRTTPTYETAVAIENITAGMSLDLCDRVVRLQDVILVMQDALLAIRQTLRRISANKAEMAFLKGGLRRNIRRRLRVFRAELRGGDVGWKRQMKREIKRLY